MAEPTSMEEYAARFHANEKMEGFGFDVSVHMPCPFCAAPGWLVYRVIEVEQAIARPSLCRECGRSARALVRREQDSVEFEMVQIGGPEQPEWLVPRMRVLPRAKCNVCGWEVHGDEIVWWREGLGCMSGAVPACEGSLEYRR